MQLHILWWACLMLSVNILCTKPYSQVQELNLQTSYLFDINCHFHAVYATLLNINVHFKV